MRFKCHSSNKTHPTSLNLHLLSIFFIVLISVSLSGCMTTTEKPPQVDLPGSTVVKGWGVQKVLDQMAWLGAKTSGRDADECYMKVVDIRYAETQLKTIVEYWTINYCGEETIYKVRVRTYANGEQKISVVPAGFVFN